MLTSPPITKHLMTVLVEDYFHVGAFEKLIHQRNWPNFEPRYERNTLKALDLFDEYDTKATFFVLGWIAEQNPQLMREIVARGHELASRGFYHRPLKNLTADEFRDDLRRTNDAITYATGQKVIGYRSAEKLDQKTNEWVLDVLASEGFAYDSSLMPNRSVPFEKRVAHQFHSDGTAIWEFPYSTFDTGVGVVPIAGGNYFRQIPYSLTRHAVAAWSRRTEQPFVSYFHVWELDPDQPRISAASNYNRIRHYRKLDKMEWILRENLGLYDCVNIATHLGLAEELKTEAVRERYEVRSESVAAKENISELTPLSIVVPCYNEAETLPYLSKALESVESGFNKIGYTSRVIFVDDCSSDNTIGVINELFDGRADVKLVRHEVNKGVAGGIMTGLRAADTEIVCSIDCDCTFDPHELLKMVPMLTDGVDMVTASPYHRDGGVQNVPGWRLLLSKGASVLYRRVLRTKIASYTSCFRVLRRSAMLDIHPTATGFYGVPEMLGLLDLKGGKIVEFPTVLAVRLFGFSKMNTMKTVLGTIKLLGHLAYLRFSGKITPIEPFTNTEQSRGSTVR